MSIRISRIFTSLSLTGIARFRILALEVIGVRRQHLQEMIEKFQMPAEEGWGGDFAPLGRLNRFRVMQQNVLSAQHFTEEEGLG